MRRMQTACLSQLGPPWHVLSSHYRHRIVVHSLSIIIKPPNPSLFKGFLKIISSSRSSQSLASSFSVMPEAQEDPNSRPNFEANARQEQLTESSFSDLSGSSSEVLAFLEGLMPKEEIGAKRFLQKYPDYDGRGILIAILDSGVDPGAAGLQTTSDGKPKIVDIVDCTGGGDVDTSTLAKMDEDGFFTGASGARLQVNLSWTNPTGQWRIGCKRLYEIFDDSLVKRVSGERRKSRTAKYRERLTEALRKLAVFDEGNGKSLDDAQKKQRQELQSHVDLLQKLDEGFEDTGPVLDAVVWHDGMHWRAALDTQDLKGDWESVGDQSGKLADFQPMTNYRIERQYGTFSRLDACNYVLNIYNDGAILSIVADVSTHGTHVAGITAAHHPEEPALNGIAPGAQLISCKIGDTRLGSMETGTGLTRALINVIENKCDLINMSYGEPTTMADRGRFVELAREVVNKHGVIFVSAAGNNGPALTTVGAPGGTSDAILGIGAYVSPSMAAAAHSLVEPPTEGLPYTWSSRGPTADGDVGVNLSAPGGAIAPVSQWSLQRRDLMNGTSMASPSACGGIALLLSGLKASGVKVAPHLVRQALQNTAFMPFDRADAILEMGSGLLQVDSAFEYMQRAKGLPDCWYKVVVNSSSGTGQTMRGVYLREPTDTIHPSEWRVTVTPCFHEDADNLNLLVPLEEHIALKSSQAWVKAPEHLLLASNGRTFNIRVDPTLLEEGVHVAEVVGVDLKAPWRGALFRTLVTVIKPAAVAVESGLQLTSFQGLTFSPGHIERRFVKVPEGATWAAATIRLSQFDTPRMFLVHTLQLIPLRRYSYREYKSYLVFPSPTSKMVSFEVEGGGTLEFTLAQFWSSGSGSPVSAIADIEIEFHGLESDLREVWIDGNVGCTRVTISSPLALERLSPSATLNWVRLAFRPTEVKLEPLGKWRDLLPNGREVHGLLLTYKVSLSESGKYTPRIPLLNDRMYENEIEGQFYMIFDVNKRLLASGNIYPKAVKLTKGDYTVCLLLRHDDVPLLEKLKKTSILFDRSLDDKSSLKLSFYTTIDDVLAGSNAFKPSAIAPGTRKPIFVAGPVEDKLPKDAAPGTTLLGRVTYGKLSVWGGGPDNGQACPAGAQVSYVVPQPSKADDKAKDAPSNEAKKPANLRLDDDLRDAKVKLLKSLPSSSDQGEEEYNDLAVALQEEYPEHLPLLSEVLRHLDDVKDKAKRESLLPQVVAAADAVVKVIDRGALALHFAMKSDAEGSEAAKVKKEMEASRDILVDALYRKGLALAAMDQAVKGKLTSGESNGCAIVPQETDKNEEESSNGEPLLPTAPSGESGESPAGGLLVLATASACSSSENTGEKITDEDEDSFENNFAEILKWVDVGQAKFALLSVKREQRSGRPGLALQVLNKMLEDDSKPPEKALYELKAVLLEELNYPEWAAHERRWDAVRFPSAYPLF